MLSILRRVLWPLNELDSEEELKGKKSLDDPESFFTVVSNPLAAQVSLLAKDEEEERDWLVKQEYWSMWADLW